MMWWIIAVVGIVLWLGFGSAFGRTHSIVRLRQRADARVAIIAETLEQVAAWCVGKAIAWWERAIRLIPKWMRSEAPTASATAGATWTSDLGMSPVASIAQVLLLPVLVVSSMYFMYEVVSALFAWTPADLEEGSARWLKHIFPAVTVGGEVGAGLAVKSLQRHRKPKREMVGAWTVFALCSAIEIIAGLRRAIGFVDLEGGNVPLLSIETLAAICIFLVSVALPISVFVTSAFVEPVLSRLQIIERCIVAPFRFVRALVLIAAAVIAGFVGILVRGIGEIGVEHVLQYLALLALAFFVVVPTELMRIIRRDVPTFDDDIQEASPVEVTEIVSAPEATAIVHIPTPPEETTADAAVVPVADDAPTDTGIPAVVPVAKLLVAPMDAPPLPANGGCSVIMQMDETFVPEGSDAAVGVPSEREEEEVTDSHAAAPPSTVTPKEREQVHEDLNAVVGSAPVGDSFADERETKPGPNRFITFRRKMPKRALGNGGGDEETDSGSLVPKSVWALCITIAAAGSAASACREKGEPKPAGAERVTFETVHASALRPAPDPSVFRTVANPAAYLRERHQVVQVLEPKLHLCLADISGSVRTLREEILRQCASFVSESVPGLERPETTGTVIPIGATGNVSTIPQATIVGDLVPVRCAIDPAFPDVPSYTTTIDQQVRLRRERLQRDLAQCAKAQQTQYGEAKGRRAKQRDEFARRTLTRFVELPPASRTDIFGTLTIVKDLIEWGRQRDGREISVQVTVISDLEDDANECAVTKTSTGGVQGIECPPNRIATARALCTMPSVSCTVHQALVGTPIRATGERFIMEKRQREAAQQAWRGFWTGIAPGKIAATTFIAPEDISAPPPATVAEKTPTLSVPSSTPESIPSTCTRLGELKAHHRAMLDQQLDDGSWQAYCRALAECIPATQPWGSLGLSETEYLLTYVWSFITRDIAKNHLCDRPFFDAIVQEWKLPES